MSTSDPVQSAWEAGGAAASRLPPASFQSLVQMLVTQALIALGQVPHPGTGRPQPQLPLARHLIDLLGVLESCSSGNLEPEEARLIAESLHVLRNSYVSATREGRSS
jgi:hypothetical protein